MSNHNPHLDQMPVVNRERSRRTLVIIIVVTGILAIAVWAALIYLLRGQDVASLVKSPYPLETPAEAVEAVAMATTAPSTQPAPAATRTFTPAPRSTSRPMPAPTDRPAPTATSVLTETPLPTNTRMPVDTPVPTDTPPPTATPSPTGAVAAFTVQVEALNVRAGPGVGYPILGQVKRDESFPISGRSEPPTWWEFDFPDGDGATRKGWVSGELTVANVPAEQVALADVIPTPPPPAPAPTAAPAPAGVYNQPGYYPLVDRCLYAMLPSGSHVKMCVEGVEVQANGDMRFDMGWTAMLVNRGGWIDKGSDAGNRNMYLTDNLGNRYDHVATGGAADGSVRMKHTETVRGWFLFLPAHADATSSTFHDDDQHLVIENIVLAK